MGELWLDKGKRRFDQLLDLSLGQNWYQRDPYILSYLIWPVIGRLVLVDGWYRRICKGKGSDFCCVTTLASNGGLHVRPSKKTSLIFFLHLHLGYLQPKFQLPILKNHQMRRKNVTLVEPLRKAKQAKCPFHWKHTNLYGVTTLDLYCPNTLEFGAENVSQ